MQCSDAMIAKNAEISAIFNSLKLAILYICILSYMKKAAHQY